MNLLTGIFVLFLLPIGIGLFIDQNSKRGRIYRKHRRSTLNLAMAYWFTGIIPALGIAFIFMLISRIGLWFRFLI